MLAFGGGLCSLSTSSFKVLQYSGIDLLKTILAILPIPIQYCNINNPATYHGITTLLYDTRGKTCQRICDRLSFIPTHRHEVTPKTSYQLLLIDNVFIFHIIFVYPFRRVRSYDNEVITRLFKSRISRPRSTPALGFPRAVVNALESGFIYEPT